MRNEPDPFSSEPEDLPPPSLYALQMEGSPAAPEGLLSWVVGLAHAHCVSPRTLVRHLLSCSDEYRKLWSVSTFFDRDCGTVNGHGHYAQMMIELIGAGQSITVDQMTMLSLSSFFPRNGEGFLARKPKWCHACLCEQARHGVRLHFPLVWSLEYYKICHTHHVPLSDCCPACGNVQSFLPSYPSLGHCSHCGESMLLQLPDGFLLNEPDVSNFNLWCADALADLVSRRIELHANGTMDYFRSNVELVCRQLAQGSRKSLCRKTGLQPFALNGWLTKGERPSLSILLHLCYGIQIMPAAMFLADSIEVAEPSNVELPTSGHRKHQPKLGYRERERIKNLLEVIINDQNDARRLVDVAKQVGVPRGTMKYWFWNECRELVLKRRAAADRHLLLKYQREHGALRAVVQGLRAQKIDLRDSQVEPELRKHRLTLLRPDLFQALAWMRIN